MQKQVIIIGLGQFGMGLARALSKYDVETIAVDSDQKRIEMAASWVTKAMCADATDEDFIAQLEPSKRDVCICATGDQSKEVGIICTALLKQLGAKRIIARANDDLHARILRLVGAQDIVNPEWDFGERFAPRILSEHVLNEMLLGSDLVVTEIKAPQSLSDKSLRDLDLFGNYGITAIAIRSLGDQLVKQPQFDTIIKEGDVIVLSAKKGVIEQFMEKVK